MQYLKSLVVGLLVSMLIYQPLLASPHQDGTRPLQSQSPEPVQQPLLPALHLDDALSVTLNESQADRIMMAQANKDTSVVPVKREVKKKDTPSPEAKAAKLLVRVVLVAAVVSVVTLLMANRPAPRTQKW